MSDCNIDCGREKCANCFGACISFFAAKINGAIDSVCDKTDFSMDI